MSAVAFAQHYERRQPSDQDQADAFGTLFAIANGRKAMEPSDRLIGERMRAHAALKGWVLQDAEPRR